MIYFICFVPAIITVIYSFYLLFKPKNIHDEFFHLSCATKKDTMIGRIRLLEEINKADYSKDIRDIEAFYSDGRITESEEEKMEDIITDTYFNKFSGRWVAFKYADLPMKMIFIVCLAYGFIYTNIVFSACYDGLTQPDFSLTTTLLIVNTTLILPYLFSLILLGFLSTFISMLNLWFSQSGGVNRAAVTSTELIRSLKPGGRRTPVVLGTAWDRTFLRF